MLEAKRLLKERLQGKRIRFTDAERAVLARKAKAVGREALLELHTIVSPNTRLRWHRCLVAHYGRTGSDQKVNSIGASAYLEQVREDPRSVHAGVASRRGSES